MSQRSRELNAMYLHEMNGAKKDSVLGRVRDLWWPIFISLWNESLPCRVLDGLDAVMAPSRERLQKMATAYARSKGAVGDKLSQVRSQWLKSNTGKMFERLVGLAIAYVLYEADSDYCILPFRKDMRRQCPGFSENSLEVKISLGSQVFTTQVDADLLMFDPTSSDTTIYLFSIKSTCKDRFHNVPFWNLLRRCAISDDFHDITAQDADVLKRVRYVAVCTDLAAEQPDFACTTGPRNLLQIDAALLDGAYVTASRAKGIACKLPFVGDQRAETFLRLSTFVQAFITGTGQ